MGLGLQIKFDKLQNIFSYCRYSDAQNYLHPFREPKFDIASPASLPSHSDCVRQCPGPIPASLGPRTDPSWTVASHSSQNSYTIEGGSPIAYVV